MRKDDNIQLHVSVSKKTIASVSSVSPWSEPFYLVGNEVLGFSQLITIFFVVI